MTPGLDVRDSPEVLEALLSWIREHGVIVRHETLPADTPAVFDGRSITLNTRFSTAEQALYAAHSFGSIVGWSLDRQGTETLFSELEEAKTRRRREKERFERALTVFRHFEEASNEFGVDVLQQVGAADWQIPYSEFFRADLDAMTLYHQEGVLPLWPLFFEGWRTRHPERASLTFPSHPIPAFTPQSIPAQEVKRGI